MSSRVCIMFVFLGACWASSGSISVAVEATPWDYSPVGKCTKHYQVPKSTSDYPLVVQKEKNVDAWNNIYVWIWDPTPAKNPTRQLVRVTPKNVGCTVLFMPNSEFHNFTLKPRGRMPEKVISTSATMNDSDGGAHYFEQEYILDKGSGYYQKHPHCYEIRLPSNERKSVGCKFAIDG